MHGTANFTVPDNAVLLTQNNVFVDTRAKTSVTLPDNVMFGVYRRLNSTWAVTADAMWTHWNHIQELRTKFSSAQPDYVQVLKWKNTWRLGFGVSYTPVMDKITIRTGFAYDESPVSDPSHRSPRIPDNDRYWLTAGFSYSMLKNITLHAAYAHLFIHDATVNRTGTTGDQLVGKYSENINIVGLQLDWRF